MTIIVHRTRSVRVTIRPPDGPAVVVENLSGNDGYEVDFSIHRAMDETLGEMSLSIYNLPADLRGELEASQVRSPSDLDQILSTLGVAQGWQVFPDAMATDGESALAVGLSLVTVEAGFDGALSVIAEGIGGRIESERDDETTYVTRFTAIENLDTVLYSKPDVVFPAGAPTYDVMTFLRIACGLGQGNATILNWESLLGQSKIDSPFYSCMPGMDVLKQLLDFLPLRWWVDGRELWIAAKEGQPYQPGAHPPYIPDPPVFPDYLLERPQRLDGGFVGARFLLTPGALPGRLLVLSDALLGLEGATPLEIQRAQVPPGLYRVEDLTHEGTTGMGESYDTSVKIKRMADVPPVI